MRKVSLALVGIIGLCFGYRALGPRGQFEPHPRSDTPTAVQEHSREAGFAHPGSALRQSDASSSAQASKGIAVPAGPRPPLPATREAGLSKVDDPGALFRLVKDPVARAKAFEEMRKIRKKEEDFLRDGLQLNEGDIRALQEIVHSSARQVRDAYLAGESPDRGLALNKDRDQRIEQLLGAEKYAKYTGYQQQKHEELSQVLGRGPKR